MMKLMLLAMCACTLQAQVPHYDVTMTPADYNLLYTRDIFSDSALPSSFDYQASHWNNTTIKFKGQSTRYYPKKSYNVKFPKTSLFQNLRTVSFNSMYTDKSSLREHLAWDLFQDMNELASRPHFGSLAINGGSKGLYLFIDKPDAYVLANRGRVVGLMYEPSDTYDSGDLTVQPDTLLKLYYDKNIGNVNDYSDLEALINALNNAPDSSFADTLQRYVDVQSVMNWFSGNILTMSGDSYSKNYLLYRDTSKQVQQWVFIPWDYDLSFGRSGDETIPYPASLLNDGFAYTFPPLSGPSSVLKDRLWNTPSLREALRLRVDTLLRTVFTEARMFPRIDSLAAAINSDLSSDPYKWGTYGDFLEHIEALKYYVTARRNYLNATFINPPSGIYDDVTLPVSQLGVPYYFIGVDGRQIASLLFSNISGLDSVRVQSFPDSVPPDVVDRAGERYVKHWISITPYPANAQFTAKLQWSYLDVAANDREVGSGVQDEHLLRPFVFDGGAWRALAGKVNAFGNFVTIDSIVATDCAPGNYFALLMSDTYTQKWFRKPLTNWQTWHDVKFYDAAHGFVVGDHGTILRTTDGGSTWSEGDVGLHLPMHSLAIPSADKMFVVGENGSFFRSADSGTSWSRVDMGTTRNLNAIYFENSQNGVIVGDSALMYRTWDGGSHWKKIESIKSNDLNCAVTSGRYVVAGGLDYLVGILDTSVIWTYKHPLPPILPPRHVSFNALATNDTSWWWAAGDNGTVVGSTPDGVQPFTWVNIPNAGRLRSIFAPGDSELYAGGDGGKIYYSTNRGSQWFTQYTADSHDLYGMTFTGAGNGYAVGSGGTILATSSAGTVTDVHSPGAVKPSGFQLEQNYPNPFNPSTTLSFEIAHTSFVLLKIFDVLGREVATIVDEQLQPGVYSRSWNAGHLASGVYFYRLEASAGVRTTPTFSQVRKLLILK